MLTFLKFLCFPCWFWFGFICDLFFSLNSLEESEKMLTKKQNLFIILILEGDTGGGDTSF